MQIDQDLVVAKAVEVLLQDPGTRSVILRGVAERLAREFTQELRARVDHNLDALEEKLQGQLADMTTMHQSALARAASLALEKVERYARERLAPALETRVSVLAESKLETLLNKTVRGIVKESAGRRVDEILDHMLRGPPSAGSSSRGGR